MSSLTPALVRHIVVAALTHYPDPGFRDGIDPPVIALDLVDAAGLMLKFDDETVALLTITVAGAES
jgi:hypothetical protein